MIAPKSVAEIVQTPAGTLVIRPKGEFKLTQVALTKSQCDGSWVLVPMNDWVSLTEACQIMELPRSSVWRLLYYTEGGKPPALVSRRLTRSKIQIQLDSILKHLETAREKVGI